MYKLRNLLFVFFTLLSTTLTAAELIELDTRSGVTQKFIFLKPEKPVASVILFAGGKGALNLSGANSIGWGGNNFLVRTREKFLAHDLMVAVVDAPSDRQSKKGMLFGFRNTAEHVTDIDQVIAYLKKQANVPVWLIGTSRGTESAASIAIASKQNPYGLVLTSSMTEENKKGSPVTDLQLDKITMPTLVTTHESDGCDYTPPDGSQTIKSMLTNAKKVELKIFSGGKEKGDPCKANSHHGYLGIEDTVVNYIANFIKSN